MPTPPYDSYIICTSPRSGSTLLCKLLAETGKSGNPNSHFHNPSLASWLETYGFHNSEFSTEQDALSAIFDAARTRGTANTGIFGLRMQRTSFDFFMQQTAALFPGLQGDAERIQAAFGHTLLIYLTRPNKLDQAISRVKATQTGLWHMAADGSELERQSEPKKPHYDADAISHHLAELSELDDAWKTWFKRERLKPLIISYDDLSSNPRKTLGVILNALGLKNSTAQSLIPPTKKLADEVNRIWADRFLAERSGG
ncbi:MAG: sulfotransferase [Rhodobacteraceae bacterium]|nr:sulfotransferase [Paracoccaceae bacterium]